MARLYIPKRAMVIAAHPDDIEFSCAGTVARWIGEGAQVCYVLCTSGDVGIAEPGMTKARAAEIREAEQQEAAAIIGVQEVVFLREPDGLLEPTIALRKKLVREIRRFKPDTVVCGDPQELWLGDGYINHPDHRAAALAAIEAVFPAAGQPNLFEELAEEGLSAHKVYKVYVIAWERGSNQTYVDITSTIDLKIAALKAHKSQMGDWDPTESIKAWAAERAKGLEIEYAESFRVITFADAAPKDETAAEAAAAPATGD
ncbi:MAG: PIG-L deacetylase family protein [Aggregatilineales bacterium]